MKYGSELEKIKVLLDEAYEQIDKGLERDTFEKIEWSVAKGLDKLLKAKNLLESNIH